MNDENTANGENSGLLRRDAGVSALISAVSQRGNSELTSSHTLGKFLLLSRVQDSATMTWLLLRQF